MHLTSQSIGSGLGCCFCFAVLCFLSLPSTLVEIIALIFLSFLQLPLELFVGFALSGLVYKSWYLNALEVSFILNLGMLAVATYHVNQSGGSQAAVAYTSVGIAFLNFVGIVTYHIYIRIKSKVQYIQAW